MDKPIVLFEDKYTRRDLEKLKKENRIWKEADIYKIQLRELFEILHPSMRFSQSYSTEEKKFVTGKMKSNGISGNWIYFPWNGYLIHTVNEKDWNLLRTNRNKNLITDNEQKKLMDCVLGFVGLSIGSHFVVACAYGGIAKTMKMAEFDSLSTSNLNRLRAGIKDIETSKIELTLREIYGINPYANLLVFENGLNENNLDDFFCKGKKLDAVFEAIDDFIMKIKLRLKARQEKVPVIMLTNLGDNLLVDIERFDKNPDLPLFNGLIGNAPEKILKAKMTEEEKVKYVIQIVGRENIPARALDSLAQMNKTLVGRPQLFSTVSMAGGVAAYLIKKLVLEDSLKSGRYYIRFGEFFI